MIPVNDFIKLAALRSSVRSYENRPVEREKIELLLEAARLAPSAVNFQPWEFIVVTGEKAKKAVRQSYDRPWIAEAPAYIVACGNHKTSWHRPADGKDHCDIDIAIAVDHITLCAASQGLGSCWVCNFDPAVLRAALQLPDETEPVAIIPVGYPAEKGAVRDKKRKTIDEISRWVED